MSKSKFWDLEVMVLVLFMGDQESISNLESSSSGQNNNAGCGQFVLCWTLTLSELNMIKTTIYYVYGTIIIL